MEPESSLSLIWRLRPDMARALESPMVSVADTRKMMHTVMMGPMANCGMRLSSRKAIAGRLNRPRFAKPLKSTLPMRRAAT